MLYRTLKLAENYQRTPKYCFISWFLFFFFHKREELMKGKIISPLCEFYYKIFFHRQLKTVKLSKEKADNSNRKCKVVCDFLSSVCSIYFCSILSLHFKKLGFVNFFVHKRNWTDLITVKNIKISVFNEAFSNSLLFIKQFSVLAFAVN